MNSSDSIDPDVHFEVDRRGFGDDFDMGRRTSGKAVASFIFGLLSLPFSILAAIPAIILGIVSLRQIDQSGGQVTGKTLAIGGLVLGSLGVIIAPALLLPAINAAREAARRNSSMNKMRMVTLSAKNYEASVRKYPSPDSVYGHEQPASWRTQLLPFMEEKALFDRYDFDSPWDSTRNKPLSKIDIAVLQSPNLNEGPGKTNYLALCGEETAFVPGQKMGDRDFTDGASKTILFVEADDDRAVPWSQPKDIDYDASRPLAGLGNHRPKVFLATFADGSTRAISSDIDPKVFHKLVTRGGNDPVDFNRLFPDR